MENQGFLVFWGAWEGVVTRKSGLGAVLCDLGLNLGGFGSMLEAFWEDFGTWAGWQKTYKNIWKTYVFWYFGVLEEVAEALFWRCWLQDGIFPASWEHLWDMLAPRWPTRRARWPT